MINVWAKTWVLGFISSVACVSHFAFMPSPEIRIEEIEVSKLVIIHL